MNVRIGDAWIGDGEPVYMIAEIGINHNGSRELAKQLIEVAARAGCDAVKFQKRTPDDCVPAHRRTELRDTPWGRMTYLEYRHRIELGEADYAELDRHCRARGLAWFASCWDERSVDFMERFEPPCYKVASAGVTDHALLAKLRTTGRPIIMSTGMCTASELAAAVAALAPAPLLLAHSCSVYPCPRELLNLRMISTLIEAYPGVPVGYSGHELGLVPTWAAVALGARFVERHVTPDRRSWGSDHGSSLEEADLAALVAGVRELEVALGDGVKRLHARELDQRRKLARIPQPAPAGSGLRNGS